MGARGRKSKAELAIVGSSGIESISRPGPPAELTKEQSREWLAIVNSEPAEKFSRGLHLALAALCRHAVTQRHVAQLIEHKEQQDELDVDEYDQLLKMQERESRCIASLLVRLNLAKTTSYGDKKKTTLKKPHEI